MLSELCGVWAKRVRQHWRPGTGAFRSPASVETWTGLRPGGLAKSAVSLRPRPRPRHLEDLLSLFQVRQSLLDRFGSFAEIEALKLKCDTCLCLESRERASKEALRWATYPAMNVASSSGLRLAVRDWTRRTNRLDQVETLQSCFNPLQMPPAGSVCDLGPGVHSASEVLLTISEFRGLQTRIRVSSEHTGGHCQPGQACCHKGSLAARDLSPPTASETCFARRCTSFSCWTTSVRVRSSCRNLFTPSKRFHRSSLGETFVNGSCSGTARWPRRFVR